MSVWIVILGNGDCSHIQCKSQCGLQSSSMLTEVQIIVECISCFWNCSTSDCGLYSLLILTIALESVGFSSSKCGRQSQSYGLQPWSVWPIVLVSMGYCYRQCSLQLISDIMNSCELFLVQTVHGQLYNNRNIDYFTGSIHV